MLELIAFIIFAIPVAWFASEFQDRRWLRLLLGCAAIVINVFLIYGFLALEQLNANASYYGGASKSLIDSTIKELDEGNTEHVIEQLKWLQVQFQPTYENRAQYEELVEDYKSRLDCD